MLSIDLRRNGLRIIDLSYLRTTFLILLTLSLFGCSSEEQIHTREVFVLNEENQQTFVRSMVGEYLITVDTLVEKFEELAPDNRYDDFVDFRNRNWTPTYIDSNRFYQSMLHKNKAFVYRHQLDLLFERYNNLQQLSVHLKHSLRDNDKDLRDQVYAQLKSDRQTVNAQLRVGG